MAVPIRPLRWYRFNRYGGTVSTAMMVPFERYYHLTILIIDSTILKTTILYSRCNSCSSLDILNNEVTLLDIVF